MKIPLTIAILGSRGRLGAALVRKWSTGHTVHGFARPDLDLLDPGTIAGVLSGGGFDVVVNCAANTNVDACELDPSGARTANAEAPAEIARCCESIGARLVHISTDYVFDGRKSGPYQETDPVSPVSAYGQSKADGESAVLAIQPNAIVARVSWVFGPEKPSFVDAILKKAMTDPQAAAVGDKWSNPTFTDDLADWLLALVLQDAPGGIYHLCNSGGCTWRDYGEFALKCAARAGATLATTTVAPVKLSDMTAFVAKRPVNTVLDAGKFEAITGIHPASWQDAVSRYVTDRVKQGIV